MIRTRSLRSWWATATAQNLPNSDPPDLHLVIEIDTATGEFTAEARMEAPAGDVTLPPSDWVTIDRVRLAAADEALDAPADGVIGADTHRGRDLNLHLSGILPGPQPQMTVAAGGAEATYLVGTTRFPTDEKRQSDVLQTLRAGQPATHLLFD